MSAPVSPSPVQAVTMHAEDVERLEKAAETCSRAGELEQAIALWAIVLRVRSETGWTAEASNVVPIR